MREIPKIPDTYEAWEEGQLGRDEGFVKRVENSDEKAIDESLGLQMISIRLHKSLIEEFKVIASIHGIGYQTLMRQSLTRFARSEMKRLAKGLTRVPPTLPLEHVNESQPQGLEREWLRGPLSRDVSYRLIVNGDLGPKEIRKLIKMLEAQEAVLSDDDEAA